MDEQLLNSALWQLFIHGFNNISNPNILKCVMSVQSFFLLRVFCALFLILNADVDLSAANTKWVWVGSIDSDFGNKSNWTTTDNNQRPGNGDTVIIPRFVTLMPYLDRNYTLSMLELAGGDLYLNGNNLSINAKFQLDSGSVYLNGETISVGILNILNGKFVSTAMSSIDADNLNLNHNGVYILDNLTAITIANNMNFINGKLNGGYGNSITFLNNSSVSGFDNAKYCMNAIVKFGNDSFTFPVGSSSFHAPVSISAPANINDKFYVKYHNAPYANVDSMKAGLNAVSHTEYWDIKRVAGNSQVFVYLSWNVNRSGISTDSNFIRVSHWDSVNSKWESYGGMVLTTVNGQRKHRSSQKVNNFSPFTLGVFNSLTPLPLSFGDVQLQQLDSSNCQIHWSYFNPQTVKMFYLQYKNSSNQWLVIDSVLPNHQDVNAINYHLRFIRPTDEADFYRLSAQNNSGEIECSKIVILKNINSTSEPQVFPNPSSLYVKICQVDWSTEDFTIMDAYGKKIPCESYIDTNSCLCISTGDLNDGYYYLYTSSKVISFCVKK